MEFTLDADGVARLIADTTNCELSESDGGYEFLFENLPPAISKLTLPIPEMESLINNIRAKEVFEDITLYDELTYEVSVREESPHPFRRLREDKLEVRDLKRHLPGLV